MKTYQDSEGRVLPTQWEALHVAEDHRRQVVSAESRGGPSALPCGHAIAGGFSVGEVQRVDPYLGALVRFTLGPPLTDPQSTGAPAHPPTPPA